ncbi:PIN domain-like protein [Mycena epipterygia]|nr:PIN domain-like protein [Mycena epipterygia]
MGTPKLWERLQDAARIHNFLEFAVSEGFKTGTGECQAIIMGVDASIWMYQAERAVTPSNAQRGPNPQLRVLFYRLATLLELPIRVVFVFDGPARPEFKRGTRVLTHGHWLTDQFRELIRHFGYHSYTAPAEADAELGRLASEGVIDAVQTTDNDVLLFGAPTVIYIPRKKKDGKNVTIYTAENLFITPSVSLTRGGLLLITLLSGADYDKGVPGCGIATAHAIARGNLGDLLLDAALQSPTPTAHFLNFLTWWREALCNEFSNDPHGHLGRKHKTIAATIAEMPSFPNLDVIFAYVHPITSWSENYLLPDSHSWGLAQPNLTSIARSCQLQFRWDAATIATKFSKFLYSGIAIQSLLKPYDLNALLQAHVESGLSFEEDFPRSSVLRIVKKKTTTSGNQTTQSYLTEMSAGALTLHVKAGLNDASAFPAPTLIIKWIPAPIIDYALPDLVSRSHISAKLSKSKAKGRPKTRAAHTTAPVAGPSRIAVNPRDIIDLTSPEPEHLNITRPHKHNT